MKILILANDSGGLFHFRRELISQLLEHNEVIISVPKTNEYKSLEKMGCELIETAVDRRGMNPLKDFRLLLSYKFILCKYNPDLVITYTIKPNIYGGMVCALYKVPYFSNITGLGSAFQKTGLFRRLAIFLYRIGLKRSKTVFFENFDNKDIFVKERIVNENNSCVLNGAGVNLKHFSYKPYPNNTETIRFLFVGRVMKEKGIDELFIATKNLFMEGYKIKLGIVGRCEEDYSSQLNEGIEEGWLENYGFQVDVRPYIVDSHCFVLPSWHEGMANTNLESAATGRPIITSNIPGCREAVINGESGYLVECKDSDSLYYAMKKMLQLSNEDRRNMGINGRKHMEINFDKKKVVEKTLEVIRDRK